MTPLGSPPALRSAVWCWQFLPRRFFYPPHVISPSSFRHSPVCACVLTVTRVLHLFLCPFPCRVKLWASAFGGEIKSIAAKYSGSQLLQKVRFLWWQEAMIFPAQKMEADLVFQTNVNPEQHQLSEVSLIPSFLGSGLCNDFSLPTGYF